MNRYIDRSRTLRLVMVVCALWLVGCSKEAPKEPATPTPTTQAEEKPPVGIAPPPEKRQEKAPATPSAKASEANTTAKTPPAPTTPSPEGERSETVFEKAPYTLTYEEPRLGDTQTRSTSMNMAMTMTIKGTNTSFKVGKLEDRTAQTEVLDVQCGAKKTDCVISKVRVKYTSAKIVETNPKGTQEKSEPTVGKTYIVTSKDGKVDVQEPSKQPVSLEEMKIIRRDHRRLGQQDVVKRLFPWGKTMKPGDVHKPPKEVMDAFMRSTQDGRKVNVGEATITFRGFETVDEQGKLAVFDIKIPVGAEVQKGVQMDMNLQGTVHIDSVTGWLNTLRVESPFQTELKQPVKGGQSMTIQGNGSMKLGIDMSYYRK